MYTFSKQLWGSHSPSTCLVQNFQIFMGDNFFHTYTLHTCFRIHSPYSYLVYTLQTHVRFKIFKFSQEIIISCLLSTRFRVHSQYSYLITLSKHMLGSTFLDFHRISFTLTLSTNVQSSLSMQLFLHSPSRCYISKFYIVIIISSCA